jgi:hypothetical protein
MALATTTLSSALAVDDTSVVVASATSFDAGRLVLVDQEMMQVAQNYTSGTTVDVLRGMNGTATTTHVVTSNVTHGDASDFSTPAAQEIIGYQASRATVISSITATGTLTLPKAGTDARVILNGGTTIALTIPVPTKDMDGTLLTIMGNFGTSSGHTLTFTGGLSGAGSSYDVVTVNATTPVAFTVMACNGLWNSFVATPLAGTVTNITATVS